MEHRKATLLDVDLLRLHEDDFDEALQRQGSWESLSGRARTVYPPDHMDGTLWVTEVAVQFAVGHQGIQLGVKVCLVATWIGLYTGRDNGEHLVTGKATCYGAFGNTEQSHAASGHCGQAKDGCLCHKFKGSFFDNGVVDRVEERSNQKKYHHSPSMGIFED
ncbi:uncharacterized protein LY89DRAFT_740332 [Mollisia scopiformis]|uniref:Uncharacterized protein n=1 Tax=Mollisia scopiformis TaxID=149040 RepID=A0A132BC17_MOLSC|nr:uncharacterized protein LY89DRAFT_740332 [Mollisia scopiformis]KUJ09921.1 hypothetical protein LY89DRAFT_740332 [Mollisia scopiformis]